MRFHLHFGLVSFFSWTQSFLWILTPPSRNTNLISIDKMLMPRTFFRFYCIWGSNGGDIWYDITISVVIKLETLIEIIHKSRSHWIKIDEDDESMTCGQGGRGHTLKRVAFEKKKWLHVRKKSCKSSEWPLGRRVKSEDGNCGWFLTKQ